jgi:hypothetical protein
MQARIIDAEVVYREKVRAVKQIHQNANDERVAGLAKKELMEALGIWDDEGIFAEGGEEVGRT